MSPMRDRTVGERVQYAVARLMMRLPDRLKLALSGEGPVIVEGQKLDPQAQLLRSVRRRRLKDGLLEPTIAAARHRYRRQAHIFRGPITRVGTVRDFDIEAGDHSLRVRHYAPRACERGQSAPLLVYLHGGGFVMGDLDTHDEPCRMLCHGADTHVISVAYRLAPEHPFPAAVDDARAALRWARANAGSLGADPHRVAIGGDSAGGTLSAVVSLIEKDQGVPPCAQLLVYPATDASTRRPSHTTFDQDFVLTRRDCKAFFRCYTGEVADASDPRISPLLARDLSTLPPTLIVVAGFDVLRDESEAYARALAEAGTVTRVKRVLDLEHGFIHATGICPAARRAMIAIAQEWRDLTGSLAALTH
jgi:acetyl esterase